MASSVKTRSSAVPARITCDDGPVLDGTLEMPAGAAAVILFAHGSGSSRHSPRNRQVAQTLQEAGLGTLLFDLLSEHEEAADAYNRELRFDIELLAGRLLAATRWVRDQPLTSSLPVGYFGASTGAAAALIAAAEPGNAVGAIVSRGGRPDLAGPALERVRAATLLIVGGADGPVIGLNRQAARRLRCEHELEIIPGASHLFEETGALDQVAGLAARWLGAHLR
jgi:putative phosphoribosyl transferase